VNLRPRVRRFSESQYALPIDVLAWISAPEFGGEGTGETDQGLALVELHNFALGKSNAAACPIQIDEVHLPPGYRA
jgi:hypothetical protein